MAMAVYKRGGKFGVDYYYQGKKIRRIVGTSKKQAEIIHGKIMAEIAEGKHMDIQKNVKITLSEFLKMYLNNHSVINNKPSTHYRNSKIAKNLIEYFGDIKLYNINTLAIERYKKARYDKGIKQATINRELALFKAVLNKAKQWKVLHTALPVIKLFKVDNGRIRYLSEEEYIKLIEVSPDILKSKIIIAVNTGLRIGELVSLKWKDVDMKQEIITVSDTKNNETRYVDINKVVAEVLSKIEKTSEGEYVFAGGKENSHISASYISHLFAKTAKKVGIQGCTFHDTRHTFASWLVMQGANLKTVQELMGHKDFKMTLRYAHLSPEYRKSAVEGLGKKCIILGKNMDNKVDVRITKSSNILVTLPETKKTDTAVNVEP